MGWASAAPQDQETAALREWQWSLAEGSDRCAANRLWEHFGSKDEKRMRRRTGRKRGGGWPGGLAEWWESVVARGDAMRCDAIEGTIRSGRRRQECLGGC